jgi:hypothetical protein
MRYTALDRRLAMTIDLLSVSLVVVALVSIGVSFNISINKQNLFVGPLVLVFAAELLYVVAALQAILILLVKAFAKSSPHARRALLIFLICVISLITIHVCFEAYLTNLNMAFKPGMTPGYGDSSA